MAVHVHNWDGKRLRRRRRRWADTEEGKWRVKEKIGGGGGIGMIVKEGGGEIKTQLQEPKLHNVTRDRVT